MIMYENSGGCACLKVNMGYNAIFDDFGKPFLKSHPCLDLPGFIGFAIVIKTGFVGVIKTEMSDASRRINEEDINEED